MSSAPVNVTAGELRREALARRLQGLADAAPRSMQAHARLLHRDDRGKPLRAALHHAEWCYYMEAPWLHNDERYRWCAIVAPPGYAKSTWCTRVYGSWRTGTDPGVRIGLISNTASLAESFAQDIRGVIEGSWYQRAYGVTPHARLPWRDGEFWTSGSRDRSNPSVHATGIGGPVQGHRYDEILLDDPTTEQEARSQTIMSQQRRWVRNTLIKRLPPDKRPPDGDGRMVASMTRWAPGDLVPLLEEEGFTIIRMPALGYWDRSIDPMTGELVYGTAPLWGQMESQAQLEAMRALDPINFDLVMQGDEKAASGGIMFDEANFQWGWPPQPGGYSNVTMYVDTSGGRKKTQGDYFAIVTIAIQADGSRDWVRDVYRDRLTAPDQQTTVVARAEMLQQMCGRLDAVIIEPKNEGIALAQNLAATARLPLQEPDPDWMKGDKEWRAIPLATGYRVRRIWHPRDEAWVPTFQGELKQFPDGPNDDMVDAAAGAYAATSQSGVRLRVLRRGG
jgi:phage terminase large subunit-like protein